VPLEATLAVCVGFNLALALLIVIYIVSLRVNPNDFRWLQPKAKARPCSYYQLQQHGHLQPVQSDDTFMVAHSWQTQSEYTHPWRPSVAGRE
jgi:hypothetical protein